MQHQITAKGMQNSFCLKFVLAAGFLPVFAPMAAAHPHVWVTARAETVFNEKGEAVAIRHAWTFDEMYSAFVTEGQGKDGQLMTKEELAPRASNNLKAVAALIPLRRRWASIFTSRRATISPAASVRLAS